MNTSDHLEPLISFKSHSHRGTCRRIAGVANFLAERLLWIDKINAIYRELPSSSHPAEFVNQVLKRFRISHSIRKEDLDAIPASGPTVVVANHPFGAIDGLLLASILCAVRPDVKIMANYFLGRIPQMRPLLFMVDPFGKKSAIGANRMILKGAVRWVRDGGVLVMFPAGEVSHFSWKTRHIEDPQWEDTVSRIIRMTRAKVVPVYFKGRNSLAFQIAGSLHPLLRTLMLPREMLKKQAAHIDLKIGSAIPYRRLTGIGKHADFTAYLRFRTYLLGNAFNKTPGFLNTPVRKKAPHKKPEPVVAPVPGADLLQEVQALGADQILSANGNLCACMAAAGQIPNVLREIGRLREVTFRQLGEGTGRSIDLDRFDDHGIHLFVWDSETRSVVGAYRLSPTDELVRKFGKEGLYTYTLFRYQTRLLSQMGPALEMSRSFVRPEYQKSYAPLLLLWKGIGRFVVRYPRYKTLFGAVSITREYSDYSRQLMTTFLENDHFLSDLSRLVNPRKPYSPKPVPELKNPNAASWPEGIEELSAWISDIETDGRGVPILLKQYLKLGGKLIGFNIDPSFGNVLDGLIMVDLTATEPKLLKRYMDPEGYEVFMAYHRPCHPQLEPAAAGTPAYMNSF